MTLYELLLATAAWCGQPTYLIKPLYGVIVVQSPSQIDDCRGRIVRCVVESKATTAEAKVADTTRCFGVNPAKE